MSKKRKREVTDFDRELVSDWDRLTDDQEDTRLSAACDIVSKFFDPQNILRDRLEGALSRLFRGLCSSRKSARLGFSVALTETLSRLKAQEMNAIDIHFSCAEVIDLLESQTSAEGNTSGQDERDHYLGRLFGADAIIKSGFIFEMHDTEEWKRLLTIITAVATKKPWLRQECGWVLYTSIAVLPKNNDVESYAVDIITILNDRQLIRTPEGVAIWLAVRQSFPSVKLPKHIWKHKEPLARKDIATLAEVLKDAKAITTETDDKLGPQGNASWTAQLHFAWDVVLSQVYDLSGGKKLNGNAEKESKKIDFQLFWKTAVDDSLFIATTSAERKHWGFLLFSKAVGQAPLSDFDAIFTKNAVQCLIHALKGDDRYLKRSALKAVRALETRFTKDHETKGKCVAPLLQQSDFIDFDHATKTKIFERILTPESNAHSSLLDLYIGLTRFPERLAPLEDTEILRRRKVVISLLGKMIDLNILNRLESYDTTQKLPTLEVVVASDIWEMWITDVYFEPKMKSVFPPQLDQETREHTKTRLVACLERGLRHGDVGRRLLREAVCLIRWLEKHREHKPIAGFDNDVAQVIKKAWKRLRQIQTSYKSEHRVWYESADDDNLEMKYDDPGELSNVFENEQQAQMQGSVFDDGLGMLYSLALLQAYGGDPEAVEILSDLLSFHKRLDLKKGSKSDEALDESDFLIEILLSFASRPSKLMRRLSLQIFEAFSSKVTSKGLQSLTRVLESKETVQGQGDIFEAQDDDVDDVEGADDSDVEMIDSDVESTSEKKSSGSESDDMSDELNGSKDDDEELNEFEAKLAAALGTRKGQDDFNEDDTSGSSDSDMDDNQMMTLDEKLGDVFREQKKASNKKKDQKDAKETIVNFKNRVLDFTDVYLRTENLSPQSLGLILPLLSLARKTTTKQLADRSCTVLRDYCSRCKGQNVPVLSSDKQSIKQATTLLKEIHAEARLEGSNARAAACSSASILVVKTLLGAGAKLRTVIDVYGDTREKLLTDKKCKVQPAFFTDWNNWCAQARGQLAR